MASMSFLFWNYSSKNFPSQSVRSSFLLKANMLKARIMMGSQKASKGRGQQLKQLTTHQMAEPRKYVAMAVVRYILVLRDWSNLLRQLTSSPGKAMVVMETQVHFWAQLGVMRGIWNWQGVLAVYRSQSLKELLYLRAIMMSAAEYMSSMMRQAIRATLKDTNLNTLMMATIMITDRMSEKIQFWPAQYHPTTTGMLRNTPRMSIMRTDTFLTQNFFCRKDIRRKKSVSMAMMETEAMMEAKLPMVSTIFAADGAQMLRIPTVSILEETRKIIRYPYSIPYPPKEFHRPKLAARMRIKLAKKMRISPPYQKQVALQLRLQLRLQEKLPRGEICRVTTSKQLEELREEGQLF